jgi:hypothetical protein
MPIRTTIVAAVASLSMTTMSLADWGTELTASDAASDDAFGISVAVDGDTCVIGARGTNSNTTSAYVFTNTSGSWSQVAELTATDGEGDILFGCSVAIDGDTCVIGAAATNSYTGSAYVFTNTDGIWSQVQKLTAIGGTSGDWFGRSVAIDGDTCVIGALGTNSSTGSAYVFTNTSGSWSQVAELTPTSGANNYWFSWSVALDGDTCVIGAPGTNTLTGNAYVFTNTGGSWSQTAELTATGGADGNYFGQSVAFDGDTCVIGAGGTNSATGSAYVFTKSDGTWSQVQKLTATGGASDDAFGNSVAIDGDTCVIGALGTNSYTGSAYVFTNTGGSWSQAAELTATGGASNDSFGNSVAIDGDTCVIGAPGTNSYTGSAYVYGSGTAATGACCVTNGCTVIAETACTELGGTWTEDGSCDDCPASCAGDTNGDGVIDIFDLLNMLSGWGVCP